MGESQVKVHYRKSELESARHQMSFRFGSTTTLFCQLMFNNMCKILKLCIQHNHGTDINPLLVRETVRVPILCPKLSLAEPLHILSGTQQQYQAAKQLNESGLMGK